MWWLVYLGVVLPLYYDYECDCECDCECACECDDRNKNHTRNKGIEFRRTVPSNASWASWCLWVKALAGDFVGVARSIHAYHGHLSCTMQLNLQKMIKNATTRPRVCEALPTTLDAANLALNCQGLPSKCPSCHCKSRRQSPESPQQQSFVPALLAGPLWIITVVTVVEGGSNKSDVHQVFLSMKSYESLRLLRQRDQTNQSNADMAHAFTRAQNVTEWSNMFIIVYIRLFHPAAREIPPLAWILRAQPCPWIDAQLRDC